MSSQRGNVQRTRKAKHQNVFAYKNTMHDSSGKNKQLNQLEFPALCPRCEEKLQWKVKYKKYKPLTQPRKCVKCEQKTVKQAYYIMCIPCAESKEACAKCLAKLEAQSDPTDLEPGTDGPEGTEDETEPGTSGQGDPGQELGSEEEEEEEEEKEGDSDEVGDRGACSANEGSDAEEQREIDTSNRETAPASSQSHSAQDGGD